ncbi:MAG: cysteine hydrolase [Candidatus Coatesbacteria bacterium]|nr:cysteine hydrolase [Candidatus Coatesbacteria bacterium]
MATEAIVIVDMLKGFLEPGNPLYCGAGARAIIPNVVSLLTSKPDAARVFVCDGHTKSDPEFGMFPPHCIEGTDEAQVVPELEVFTGRIVRKRTFDGFFGTDLAEVLGELAPDKVYAVGVCTDICVLYTVAGLRLRGCEVIVPRNCVASFDKDSHEWALRHFAKVLGAEVA